MQLYFVFNDLEMVFDTVSRESVWLALRKVTLDEWLVLVKIKLFNNSWSYEPF